MKMERFFYEESKAIDRLVEAEVEAEIREMTEEKQIRDNVQKLNEEQAIAEIAENKIEEMLENVSQERVEHFEKMAKKAIGIAEAMFLNVKIDSEKGYVGTIEFTGEIMIINEFLEKNVIQDFRELMCSTEEILIAPIEKLVRIILYYHFSQEFQGGDKEMTPT